MIFKKSCDNHVSDELEITAEAIQGKLFYFIDIHEDGREAGVLYCPESMIELRDALLKEFPLGRGNPSTLVSYQESPL